MPINRTIPLKTKEQIIHELKQLTKEKESLIDTLLDEKEYLQEKERQLKWELDRIIYFEGFITKE